MRALLALALLLALAAAAWLLTRAPAPAPATEPAAAPLSQVEAQDPDVDLASAPAPSAQPKREELPAPAAVPSLHLRGTLRRAEPGTPKDLALPAPGASLELALFLKGSGKPFDEPITTDEQGRFELTLENPELRGGSVRLTARPKRDGFAHARHSEFFEPGTTELLELDLVQYAFAELAGQVTSEDGRPLSGVDVTFKDAGTPRSQVTDTEGRFAFERVWSPQQCELTLEGWVAIHISSPVQEEDGTWRPVQAIMGPTATLVLRLQDGLGRGVPGRWVRAEMAPAEALGPRDGVWAPNNVLDVRGETDEAGQLRLDGLVASKRLVVTLQDVEHEWVTAEGLLVQEATPEQPAGPLRLDPGEVREVHLVHGMPVRLAGRVLEPDGQPSPKAYVELWDLEVAGDEAPGTLATVRTDEDGHFTVDHVPERAPGRVLVSARGSIGEQPPKSMFGGTRRPDPLHAAWQTVVLDEEGRGPDGLLLQLEVMQSLAGKLVDEKGKGVDGEVVLHPAAPSPIPGVLPTRTYLRRRSGGNGEFRFTGLPPGDYDVEAHAWDKGQAQQEAVPAGTQDLLLRLSTEGQAVVHITVEPSAPMSQVILLSSRLEPWDPQGVEAPELPTEASYRDPFGWPEDALGLWYGAQTYHGPLGQAMFSSWPIEGTERTIRRPPGLYWFGAKGAVEGGGRVFPLGTGLVRLRPGEHRLTFHLTPSAKLEGQVPPEWAARGDAAQVVLPDGRPVPLDVGRDRLRGLIDLAADGSFEVHSIPSGELELRVGAPEELRAGRYHSRLPLKAPAGGTVSADLR